MQNQQPKFDPDLDVSYTAQDNVMRYKAYVMARSWARTRLDRIMKFYNIKTVDDFVVQKATIFNARLKFHTIISKNVTKPWIVMKDADWGREYPIGLNEFETLLKLENTSMIKYPDFSWEGQWMIYYKAGFSLYPITQPVKEIKHRDEKR